MPLPDLKVVEGISTQTEATPKEEDNGRLSVCGGPKTDAAAGIPGVAGEWLRDLLLHSSKLCSSCQVPLPCDQRHPPLS